MIAGPSQPPPEAIARGAPAPHDVRRDPRLLLLTSAAALARNIGTDATQTVLAGLERRGAMVDGLAEHATSLQAAALVRQTVATDGPFDGVVVVGGYDVVPAQRLDSLGPSLRKALPDAPDPDDFVVWSDDVYGDTDGDGLPELPVSRIPDGYTPAVLQAALDLPPAGLTSRSGIRNVSRPFADDVFALLPGTGVMLRSGTTTAQDQPPYDLRAETIYFVLHGEYQDGSQLFGESDDTNPVALAIPNVPKAPGAVVLSGACWAGLTTDTPAVYAKTGSPVRQRKVGESVALSFLAGGARAFIGCTGSHYSPTVAPYHYDGEPLHRAFWARALAGTPPARALFEAKYTDYAPAIPHGQAGTIAEACECKVLREFTCLGIGW